jgi:hypothetical protein
VAAWNDAPRRLTRAKLMPVRIIPFKLAPSRTRSLPLLVGYSQVWLTGAIPLTFKPPLPASSISFPVADMR